jgi:hypothetical protein
LLKVFPDDAIRRGVFEMGHLCALLVASIIVTPLWVRFLGQTKGQSIVSLWMVQFSAKLYLLVKTLYFSRMIWDFTFLRKKYLIPRIPVRWGHTSPSVITFRGREFDEPNEGLSLSTIFCCF